MLPPNREIQSVDKPSFLQISEGRCVRINRQDSPVRSIRGAIAFCNSSSFVLGPADKQAHSEVIRLLIWPSRRRT